MQLVVYHTVVRGYVLSDRAVGRDPFAETVRQSRSVWISNEAASVFLEIASSALPSQVHRKLPLAFTDLGER